MICAPLVLRTGQLHLTQVPHPIESRGCAKPLQGHVMNQNQTNKLPTKADETAQPAPAAIEIKDLEPEQDVAGGMKCANNLKQMGIA